MWQKTDGGEMTFGSAAGFCKSLNLGGFSDWRLPTSLELFSINNYDNLNPAMNSIYFPVTNAQYWWTCEYRTDDPTMVWVVNAGGGIGAHPINETVSAGGTKQFHTRAVRNKGSMAYKTPHFNDNGDGTISDILTGLIWQKNQSPDILSWEDALIYASNLSLSGKSDWRLPNIKELQSLNDVNRSKPSFNNSYFPGILSGNYWSSTTLYKSPEKAWDINVDYGIVSYNNKTLKENVLCVRGGLN
jgi:hypothetical protein